MQTLEGASKTKRGGEEGKPEFCWNEAFDPSQTLAGGSCSPTGKHTGTRLLQRLPAGCCVMYEDTKNKINQPTSPQEGCAPREAWLN